MLSFRQGLSFLQLTRTCATVKLHDKPLRGNWNFYLLSFEVLASSFSLYSTAPALEYSKTLNMGQTKFPMKADAAVREPHLREEWSSDYQVAFKVHASYKHWKIFHCGFFTMVHPMQMVTFTLDMH